MNVTPEGFAGLTRSVMQIAESCCGGKVVITLEGGYDLQGLRDSVKSVLKELAGISETPIGDLRGKADQKALDDLTQRVAQIPRPYRKRL